MKRAVLFFLLVLITTACSSPPSANPLPTENPVLATALAQASPNSAEEVLTPPQSFAEIPEWLAALSRSASTTGDGMSEALQTLESGGFMAADTDGREADLTGDGIAEWVILVTDPASDEMAWGKQGLVLVINEDAGAPLYQSSADEFSAPSLVGVADVTGDKVDDLVYEITSCGANTCYQNYHVVSWHGGTEPRELLSDGQNEIPDAYPMSYSEATLEDRTGDDVADLVLVGGMAGSAGAGPQRERTEVLAFDGAMMSLVETTYETTPLRYFRLLDANLAFEAGDYEAATTLYDEAINDATLEDSGYEINTDTSIKESDAIHQYAAFRLVLIALLQGNSAMADEHLAALQSAYPDSAVTAAAQRLVDDVTASTDVASACAHVRESLADTPAATGPLAYMGYTNPELTAETLCPVK